MVRDGLRPPHHEELVTPQDYDEAPGASRNSATRPNGAPRRCGWAAGNDANLRQPHKRISSTGVSTMHGTTTQIDAARERAYAMPLDQFDVGNPALFQKYEFWPYFERLRKEEPVHYCKDS